MKTKLLVFLFCLLIFGCNIPYKIQSPQEPPKVKTIKNTYPVTGDNGVILTVEIEYSLTEKGYLNNGCQAQFIVTNTGTVAYNWKEQKKNKIVFEFSTSDGKVIEKQSTFFTNLQPGNTGSVEKASIDAGLNRFCTGVRAVRMEN